VDFGRVDKNDLKHRQKNSKSVVPSEKYHKMVERREQIKKNTNKINCFVDESQPAFINTMSRTMDAYDIRMSTFGGARMNQADKSRAYEQFIGEKRGFIRTSNGFYSTDPLVIVNEE